MVQQSLGWHVLNIITPSLCIPAAAVLQESLGGYGEEGSFPATASTAAAQQALTQSRQRRDERALDKGNLYYSCQSLKA